MFSIYEELEKTYCNIHRSKFDENLIYKPDSLSNRYYCSSARYDTKVNTCEYNPYVINLKLYQGLFDAINLTEFNVNIDLNSFNEMKDDVYRSIILSSVNNRYLINTPNYIDNLILDEDITPAGLLALRLNKFYDNKEFKKVIESKLLSIYFEYNKELGYYIVNDKYLEFDKEDFLTYLHIAKSLKDPSINKFIFKWR